MEFSHPNLLWTLPAVALPVLIHLINRHRARLRPFAAIDFLLRVQRRSARRILLKQLLLLLLRTLMLLALILAAAGPRWKTTAHEPGPGPIARALVIDASLSMRTRIEDGDLFGRALQRARNLVRQSRAGDSTCLLLADLKPRSLLEACSDSPARLLSVLDELEKQGPGWSSCDLIQSVEQAAALLARDPREHKRIILLSDGAAHAIGQSTARWPEELGAVQVRLEDLHHDGARVNHAVTGAQLIHGAQEIELQARFFHHGPEATERAVRVELDGAQVTQGLLRMTSESSIHKSFSLPAGDGRDRIGLVALPEDQLAEDDSRPFFLAGTASLNALLVNGDMRPVLHKDELFYLEHALAPASAGGPGGRIRFSSLTPERLVPERLREFQVLILANVRQLKAETAQALRDFVQAGGGLLLAMGDRMDVDQGNAIYGDLLAWPLRDVVALGPLESDGRAVQGLAFGWADPEHPMLQAFGPRAEKTLGGVRTRRAFVLEPGPDSAGRKVLLRFSNSLPALVERRLGAGRVLLFTSSLDRDWTNWPARASFLPFLQQTVAYLASRLQRRDPLEIEVGQPVSIPLAEGADSVLVTCPHGRFTLSRDDSADPGGVVFEQSSRPGWCKIEQISAGQGLANDGPPGLLIGLPASESDPRPVDPVDLNRALGRMEASLVSGPQVPLNRPVTGDLLLLALLLVLAESVLIRR